MRTAWVAHRALVSVTRGRLGYRPATAEQWGMLRLHTIGRRSGQERLAILGYFEDGANLVTLAMNGWGEGEPAWWLNLQAQPDAVVELSDGPRFVRGPRRDRRRAPAPLGPLRHGREPRRLRGPPIRRDRRRDPGAADGFGLVVLVDWRRRRPVRCRPTYPSSSLTPRESIAAIENAAKRRASARYVGASPNCSTAPPTISMAMGGTA